ncbi:hypothetical protein BTE56_02485 [Agrobacterium pusense]|nr:hypothetical protein BTE56_02485 [Agrobacterium pusense]
MLELQHLIRTNRCFWIFKAAARRDVRDIIGRLMNISGVVTTARRPVAISGRLGAPGAIDQGRRFEDPWILLFPRSACGGSDQADPADARRLNQLRPRSTFF